MKNSRFFTILIFISCSFSQLRGEEDNTSTKEAVENKEESGEKNRKEPPKIGNFALPTSQQPASLFGFGGNIIDANEIQCNLFIDDFIGKQRTAIDFIPNVVFGITQDFSVYFAFPFTPFSKEDRHRSSGLEDFVIQLEYAFYNHSTYAYVDQATLVGNITLPTGSIKKDPPTGFGAPAFFIGATYYRTMVDWFLFTAQGALLPTSGHRTKFGDQFLYQFGVGKNMPSPEGWIYAWMVELDGQYSKKNRIHGTLDTNSGGTVLYATPSLWISSKYLLWQFGVSFPLAQNLFGRQRKFGCGFNFNFAWSFY